MLGERVQISDRMIRRLGEIHECQQLRRALPRFLQIEAGNLEERHGDIFGDGK